MTVKRIVANIATKDVDQLRQFYLDLLDLNIAMDMGWIVTLVSGESSVTQVSVMSEGGSGTPVPDISIEVDDVDAVYRRARDQGHAITYELTDEPWGVRRFYLRDPAGKLVNILSHRG